MKAQTTDTSGTCTSKSSRTDTSRSAACSRSASVTCTPPPFQTLRLRNIHSYRIPRHIYTRACNRKGMDPGYVRTALKKADVQILCPARILLQSVPPHQLLTAPAPKSHAHTFVSCICRSSRATGRRHWLAHSTNRSNGCMA